MTWTDAIITVLQQSKNNDEYIPMHYIDITNSIVENNFKEILGKTPQNTVRMSLSTNKELFESCGPRTGVYKLTTKGENYEICVASTQKEEKEEAIIINQKIKENNESKVIKVFGMYWNRADISWEKVPRLLGRQSPKAEYVDFSDIRGIYLLYDRREVIYVGQAIDQSILKRLRQHTTDHLSGRWERFSWFGIDGIDPASGSIIKSSQLLNIDIGNLVDALEGIMIEGLEPRQNRYKGNQFGDEYLQVVDKDIQKRRIINELI